MKSKIMNKWHGQGSESFLLGAFLSFSGGFQDAYTYIVRDHVFANAQTGNVVLMSTCMMRGQWLDSLSYLLPLLCFAAGILFADFIRYHDKNGKGIHWRQKILVIEILALFAVGFLPQTLNMTANMIVSFACAMQVQSFRKLRGNPYASTMCIGNLRSGTAALSAYLRDRDKAEFRRMLYYYGIITFFALGAGIGGNLSNLLGGYTIWLSCLFLVAGFWIMRGDLMIIRIFTANK